MAQVLINDQVVVPNGAPADTPCGDKRTGQSCPAVLWSEPVHPDGEEKTVTVVFSTSQQTPSVRLVAAPTQQCFEGQFTVEYYALGESPVLAAIECADSLSFDWDAKGPKTQAGNLGSMFEVRAYGRVMLEGGKHRFGSAHTGGVWIEIDGEEALDATQTDSQDSVPMWGRELIFNEGLHDVRYKFKAGKVAKSQKAKLLMVRSPECARGEWAVSLYADSRRSETSFISAVCHQELTASALEKEDARAKGFRAVGNLPLDEGTYRFDVTAKDAVLLVDSAMVLSHDQQNDAHLARRSTPVALSEPLAPLEFVGCFKDVAPAPKLSAPNTITCAHHCRGQPFGLRDGECVCDPTTRTAVKVETAECGGVCAGEEGLMPMRYCGKQGNLAVFREISLPETHEVVLEASIDRDHLPELQVIQDPKCGPAQWKVEWFLTTNFHESHAVSCHDTLDFAFTNGKVPEQLPADHPLDQFSLRATSATDFGPQGADFRIGTKGASRVSVNGMNLFERAGKGEIWTDPQRLAGSMPIVFEHKSSKENAFAKLELKKLPDCAVGQFRVDAFAQWDHMGWTSATCVSEDSENWASHPALKSAASLRATGTLRLSKGLYRFSAQSKNAEVSVLAKDFSRMEPVVWSSSKDDSDWTEPVDIEGLRVVSLAWRNTSKEHLKFERVANCTDGQWTVSYFRRVDEQDMWSGSHCQENLDVSGPPPKVVGNHPFHIVATAEMEFDETDDFRFALKSAPGSKFTLDGSNVHLDRGSHGDAFISDSTHVFAGRHTLSAMTAVGTGESGVKLDIAKDPTCAIGELKVEYFTMGAKGGQEFAHVECKKGTLFDFNNAPLPNHGGSVAFKATGRMEFPLGSYRFGSLGAGAAKVKVDGQDLRLMSSSKSSSWSAVKNLGGEHFVELSLQEPSKSAKAGVTWQKDCSCNKDEWCLEWYKKQSGSEVWAASTCSKKLDFHWKDSPAAGGGTVHASQTIDMESAGNLRFKVKSEDAQHQKVEVRVDDHHLDFIDGTAQNEAVHERRSVRKGLKSGKHTITLFARSGVHSGISLEWTQDPKCQGNDFLVEWFLNSKAIDDNSWEATCEKTLDWDWQKKRPIFDPRTVPSDVAFRAVGQMPLETSAYRFFFTGVDAKLSLDGKALKGFKSDGVQLVTDPLEVAAGEHAVVFEGRAATRAPTMLSTRRIQDCKLNQFRVSYYSTPDFEKFVASECADEVNFKWGASGPKVLNGQTDDFSVRAVGKMKFSKGRYRLGSQSDNGAMIKLDGQEVLKWFPQHTNFARYSDVMELEGEHVIELDYMETNGEAQMVLMTPKIPDCPLNQFQVDFFNNDKSDGPDARWVSSECVENLSTKGPSPGLKLIKAKHGGVVRQYSMVAHGNFELGAGQWRFSSQTEAGARLHVNNEQVINSLSGNANRVYKGSPVAMLEGQQVNISFAVDEVLNDDVVDLSWTRDEKCSEGDFILELFKDAGKSRIAKSKCVATPQLAGMEDGSVSSVNLELAAAESGETRKYLAFRASGTMHFDRGVYRFHAEGGRRARIFVDGQEMTTFARRSASWSRSVELSGYHQVRVEVPRNVESKKLKLEIAKSAACEKGEWTVNFYSAAVWGQGGVGEWLGQACHSKLDRTAVSLAPKHVPRKALEDGAFVTRATATVHFEKGSYRVGVEDAGSKLFIDNKAVADVARQPGAVQLRFSDGAVELEGDHEFSYEWNAHSGSMRAFWSAVPVCGEDQWLVQFFQNQESYSFLGAECRENSWSKAEVVPHTFSAQFAAAAADGTHSAVVWPKHGQDVTKAPLLMRASSHSKVQSGRYRFTTAGSATRVALDGQSVPGFSVDGFRSESRVVTEGNHHLTAQFNAFVGEPASLIFASEPNCPDGKLRVEWFWQEFYTATGDAWAVSCETPDDLKKGLPEKALPKFKANHGGFSVRISGKVNFKQAGYRFMGATRGAVKASIDGVSMIDFSGKVAKEERQWSKTMPLSGLHEVRFEFQESGPVPSARLFWEETPACGKCNWLVEYFQNSEVEEAHFVSQQCISGSSQPQLDFKDTTLPEMLGTGDFSMKATTTCGFDSGNYIFTIPSDHQGRVKVDGGILIDSGLEQDKKPEVSSKATLISAGDHTIVLEQYESKGVASAHVSWSSLKA
eukprot:gnl/MRDRNA2_/MRDRNA2_86801_c0_seq1.p1 gnl/MRDRNA2_/MRDRNA2_86801_c0~~gnl/MRDRNA2_/MRDRNA2_86801_c0_seq1.p1  ORF type:complete len:2332 (-),score=571.89 gnl/MRDRNA2_/MRDRNA2_86801_c0_seq1:550-6945(-)